MHAARYALTATLVASLLSGPPSGWGADINTGSGPALVESVRGELAAMVKASPQERARLVSEFHEIRAMETQEAWKRFRNPELLDLFLDLSSHDDWHVVHRALTALEHYDDPRVLETAWGLLFHSHPRVRERAAVTCLRTWNPRVVPRLSQGDVEGALAALLDGEGSPFLRAGLEALQRRHRGKLKPEQVSEEFTLRDRDGLVHTPFLSGMHESKKAAPGWTKKVFSKSGGGSAGKLPAADRWVMPLMDWGKEEVPGASLQPFDNPRENGMVHTGHDVGASFDGAGYYAVADGIVKMVNAGSDMGTLLVVEHHLGDGDLVTSLYMHGADTVFVRAGEKVEAGQILGSMGLSYSLENGGHYAHLHFGLYPGPFIATHNYGYKKKAAGLSDWFDPQVMLPRWADWTAPLESAAEAVSRAERILADGFPGRARGLLEEASKKFGANGPAGERVKAWKKDDAFGRALDAEERFRRTAATEDRILGKKGGPEKARALWKALLEEVGETPLASRIRARLEALP